MTKATNKTTKKTAKTITKTTTKTTFKAPALLHKGFQAYIGLYGAAYEAALPVFDKAVKNATKNYDEFATKGEKLELVATTYAKDTRKTVTEFAKARFEKRSAQLRSFVPGAANDRVVELEAEIAKLNKKIAAKAKTTAKKATKRVTKVTKTVEQKASKAA